MGKVKWQSIVDTMAIIPWVIMIWYFGEKKNRNVIEWGLLLFAFTGLIIDLYYALKLLWPFINRYHSDKDQQLPEKKPCLQASQQSPQLEESEIDQ